MYLYMITNNINNKKYIGITNNPSKRWANHKCGNSPTMAIAQAIKKYGKENFTFEILKSNIPIDEIDKYEQIYIKKYHTHVSENRGYNISHGGRYFQGVVQNTQGENNPNAHLTKEEVQYIKSHRNIPMYVLYEDYAEKITYQAFRDIYRDKTYKNIKPTVAEYPYNNEFSAQFATTGKLCYNEVVELREKYNQQIPWREVYEDYKEVYPNEMSFWNIYNGNRYKLVMPEVFTEENKKAHRSIKASGENNTKAKLTWKQVDKIRYEFEHEIKTRKELQEEYNFVTPHSINNILRYATWNKK